MHSLGIAVLRSFREHVEVQATQKNGEGGEGHPGQTHWGEGGSMLSSAKLAIGRCAGSPSSRMSGGLNKRRWVRDGACRLVGDQGPEKAMLTS